MVAGTFSTGLELLDQVWGLKSFPPELQIPLNASFPVSPFVVLEVPSLCQQSLTIDKRSGPKKLSVEFVNFK